MSGRIYLGPRIPSMVLMRCTGCGRAVLHRVLTWHGGRDCTVQCLFCDVVAAGKFKGGRIEYTRTVEDRDDDAKNGPAQ